MSDRKIEILKRLQSSKSNITKIKTESEQNEVNIIISSISSIIDPPLIKINLA